MKKSPDQQLKERIIDAIGKEGLLKGRNLKNLDVDYLSKGISIDEWVLFVESQIHAEEVNDGE